MVYKYLLVYFFLISNSMIYAQSNRFAYHHLTEEQKEKPAPFCLKNTVEVKESLGRLNIAIKHETAQWIYVTCTAAQIEALYQQKEVPNYYLERSSPTLLLDSARIHHGVDLVHSGTGLSSSYKGQNVIIGYVDTGAELDHPDLQNPDGSTRVLRYWDQSTSVGPTASSYGYGIVWNNADIDADLCTSVDVAAHGTTVTGAGSGGGLITGYNQGMAPLSDIVIVKTDFSIPNWTLTVADACDYIFKVADTLGKPAVVNLSLGDYFGSHDGNDPASVLIETLLDEKKGRIVVSACGNSANIGKYHSRGIIDADTNFVWFNVNPGGSLGPNTVYFDLFSDMADANYSYAFKAVNPANNFEVRGSTVFRPATLSLDTPILDTIWNGANRIATIEIYTYDEGSNFHMEGFISFADSASYNYGFYTTGSGNYDLWSGAVFGLNSMVEAVPSSAIYPSIIHYNGPDSLQSIVSSWNCSEKVISVGNLKNRTSFPNLAGGTYFPSDIIPVGKLSINSSKGPNRHNYTKPDITASGDVMLSAAPLWYLANVGNHNKVDTGGWHMTNGGTSMASPVVAGIAALFLEKCSNATYQDFKDAMIASAGTNSYTGVLPNFAYGNGIVQAHDILTSNEFSVTLTGDTTICVDPLLIGTATSATLETFLWSNGDVTSTSTVTTPQIIYLETYNENGCGAKSDTLTITQLTIPTINPITVVTEFTVLSTTASNSYQWTLNGVDIPGATTSSLTISEPYGVYTCYTTSADGCKVETSPLTLTLSLKDLDQSKSVLYPNPSVDFIYFSDDLKIESVSAIDLNGKQINLLKTSDNKFDVRGLSKGSYTLKIKSEKGITQTKLVKQ